MENLIPSGGAYIFKSGKHAGLSLENLFFDEFSLIAYLYQNRSKYGYAPLGKHLDFVFAATHYLEVSALCPYCKTDAVKNFYLMPPGNIMAQKYVACDKEDCHKEVVINHNGYLRLPISFDSLKHLDSDSKKDMAVRLFKHLYGLPAHLETETGFDFLKTTFPEPEPAPEPEKFVSLPKKKKVVQLNLFQF